MNNINGGKNIFTPFKKFEWILNNKNETFTKKSESLVEVWQNLALCKFEHSDLQHIVQIIDWAKLHTLNIVLTGEWEKFKDRFQEALLKEVKATQNQVTKINNAFHTRCQKLLDVINNPWSDPTLEHLVRTPNAEIGPKEIEFFRVETAYIISVRLKKLCESQCEDLALNLVKAFMKCYRLSRTDNFNLNTTEMQVWFIFDMYVALLYKFKENDSLLEMLKGLSAETGLKLIRRFAKKRVKISKVWKHCHRIAILASQVYISSTILKPIEEIQGILKELIKTYISLYTTEEFLKDVVDSVRSIIRLAETAAHIYIFCDVFQEQFEVKMKAFIIELYIRALTTDMNLLERQKSDNEKEKMVETTKRLANGFTNLAEVLKSDVNVSRECILTAFSLQPTIDRIRKIEELAKLSGFEVLDTGQEWKCKLHPPVLPSDDIAWICNDCGEYMCKPQLNVPLNTTNIALNEALTEEKLGITRELCDDLVVLLSSPRYQVFSWLLDWQNLHRLCVMYLNDPERTKNLVTELKFLDIDYSIFASIKKEPLDEYAGIERGYEHYLDHEFNSDDEDDDDASNASEDTGSQESRFYSMSSDSASEIYPLPIGPPPKSDPNTLKSLRMFRPSLKRSRNNTEANVPEKMLKSELADFAIPSSSKQAELPVTPTVYSSQFVNNSSVATSFFKPGVPSFTSLLESEKKSSSISSSTTQSSFVPIKLMYFPKDIQNRNVGPSTASEQMKSDILQSDPKVSDKHKEELLYDQNIPSPSLNNISSYRNSLPLHNSPISNKISLNSTQVNQFNHKNYFDSSYYKTYPGKDVDVPKEHCSATQTSFDISNKASVNDSNSKNGQVATLQQVGGQVAIEKGPTNKSMDLNPVHGNPNNFNCSEVQVNKEAYCTINLSQELQQNNSIQQRETVYITKETAAVKDHNSSIDTAKTEKEIQHIVSLNTFDSNQNINGVNTKSKVFSKEVLQLEEEIWNYSQTDVKELHDDRKMVLGSSIKASDNMREKESKMSNQVNSEKVVINCKINKDEQLNIVSNPNFECTKFESETSEEETNYELEDIRWDSKYLRSYSRKPKSKEMESASKEISSAITNFLYNCDDSIISIEDSNAGYADTLISSDSEFAFFSMTNPILHNIMNKIDSFEKNIKPKEYLTESQPDPSSYKSKKLVSKEVILCEKEIVKKRNKRYLRKEPKYESYPETGSDSQVEQDSDDQYNRCYIELYKNNLLYDATKGVCKNIDYYLKKYNNSCNKIDSPLKRGKKSKKGSPLKKNRRSKTGNTSDKTVLDVDKTKPKSDIPIRDIRVILNRLPAAFYKKECDTKIDSKHDSSRTKGEQSAKGKHEADKENSSSTNISLTSSHEEECRLKPSEDKEKGVTDERSNHKKSCDKLSSSSSECRNTKGKDTSTSGDGDKNHLKRELKGTLRDYTRSINKTSCSKFPDKDSKPKQIDQIEIKNPKVVLERLSITNSSYVRSVLANVPGLHDTRLMRPANTDLVINVVQVAGGRNNTSVPVGNAQTSTQVTPHIQRIGQPRFEKPQNDQTDNVECAVTSAVTSIGSSTKPTTSQPSTLINILSQQVIRPGQSNSIRTRQSPLINIVSHQIIRPSTQVVPKMITSSAQTNEQVKDSTKTGTSSEQSTLTTANVKNATATVKTQSGTSAPAPGTILQFICKSATLPKFQQAFGKTVYQTNSVESDASTTVQNSNISSDASKKTSVKNPTVNIQPIQGSVIYTRQVPVGQTINLIPPGRQVFRIATSNPDQISLVKDTVIHSKMSALLTAALQGKKTTEVQVDGDGNNDVERVTVSRPTLVQNTRIVKPVIQIPSNVIRTSTHTQSNLSSTTLEQLREFDMVYKQIKERSNTGTTPSESSTQSEPETSPQGISVTYLNQGQKFTQLSPVVVVSSYCNLQPAASPALSVTSQGSSSPCVTPAPTPTLPKVSSKTSSKGKSLKNASTHTSKASPIPKPQQKPQEDEHTTQRIFDILAEYAEQLRNSPDLNNKPAPRRRSNPPTNPNHNSKRKKSSSSKKPATTGSAISESDLDDQRTIGSEDSSCGVVQLSVKDDEQTQSQATESNDSTTSTRPLILTETNTNATTRNLIIADSTVGEALKLQNTAVLVPGNYIMPVSMVKGGQQIAVVSGGSKILATVPARSGPNMLLFQSFLNQNRKPGVPTVKYSTLQPISGISSQNLAGVAGQSPVIIPQNAHNLTAVTLGQPLTLKKIEDSDNRVNTELLLAIAQPRENAGATENSSQPDSSTSVQNSNSIKLDGVHSNSSSEKVYAYQKSATATPIATPVISQTSHMKSDEVTASTQSSIITLNIASENNKDDVCKPTKRVQSVLVTACSSNGPMLSHTPPRYRKPSESTPINNEVNLKGGYLHNGEKQKDETKHFQTTAVYFPNKNKKVATNPARLDRELQHQLCLQRKQAALERELRLQKSLSEECEDLGVDEPSTSDLFPEADLLFDSNHSPSFDQTSQDIGKKILHQDIKDKTITLFSDDDNSSSLRTDFLFDSVQYQTEGELQYERSRQLTNGQSSTSNESGSSCEDNTLLQNCASMSDVTLNSPISPEFTDNPTHMNKYKFKYSNRKKTERHKQVETWATGGEVLGSEDMCSELEKIAHSPKRCIIKRGSHSSSCDEDEEFKVVRVAISKTDLAKDEESCEESHYEDDLDSPSGRGARRSVKKMCSCCNGAQEGNRKRPSSRPHTPALHKRAFLNKKR
ncbi:hypothetical protein HHI36_023638 [Cryptolaemus montrouzieri]|uniref:Zinc finger protein Rlf/292/654 TPR repeats domain-containing protein n=1 Tax=Cryptolaemus montrouzieri TaxID=559131 RepID=A0ABD2PH73_9CUCU